jgi:hypothetical protein
MTRESGRRALDAIISHRVLNPRFPPNRLDALIQINAPARLPPDTFGRLLLPKNR